MFPIPPQYSLRLAEEFAEIIFQDIDEDGYLAADKVTLLLCIAARMGATTLLNDLISKGVDVNEHDECGGTPLYYAIQSDTIEVVDLLICARADINARDNHGRMPLHHAARRKFEKCELLIKAGANVYVRDPDGKTPLNIAAVDGSPKTVKLLIEAGADIHAKSSGGVTPLAAALEMHDQGGNRG